MLPATYKLPPMYAPPVTCRAPLPAPVFCVALVIVTMPLAPNVVNAPVPAVTLPIATACRPPTFAVVKVVAPVTVNVPVTEPLTMVVLPVLTLA